MNPPNARAALLTPDQAVRAQRLAAARLDVRAIAGILDVPEERVLRSFRQQQARAELAAWGPDDDCQPYPLGRASGAR